MKKKLLLLVAAFCFLGIGAQAQKSITTMSKGTFVGSVRLGYNSNGLPVAIALDYGVVSGFINGNAAVSVGGELGSTLYTYPDVDGSNKLGLHLGLAARANFHYQFVENLDTYAGLKAGVTFNADKLLSPGVHVGARYYFGKLAVNLELDGSFAGDLIPGGSIGVSMKL